MREPNPERPAKASGEGYRNGWKKKGVFFFKHPTMKGNTQYFSASEAQRYPTHSGNHSPLLALTAATAYPKGVLYLFCRSKSSNILLQSAAMVLCS